MNKATNFEEFEDALQKNPKDIKAHIDLSNALFGEGKISDCYSLLINAIKINSSVVNLRVLLFAQIWSSK